MRSQLRFRYLFTMVLLAVVALIPRVSIADDNELHLDKPHPTLVLPSLKEGEVLSVDNYRGHKLILVHFATWSEKSREELLRWKAESKRTNGDRKFEVVGVAHDVQVDRVRLFAQWKNVDFPIMHDALNLSRTAKLPLVVGVDESGCVRVLDPTPKKLGSEFTEKKFERGRERAAVTELPDPRYTQRMADESRESPEACIYGDALVLAGLPQQIDAAINAYQSAINLKTKDPYVWFRQGVAHRIRYDRADRHDGDLQAAVDGWSHAARMAKDNQVFLDLLRLYGGGAVNEGVSYSWIPVAQKESAARHESPAALSSTPLSCEMEPSEHLDKWRKAAKMPEDFQKDAIADEQEFVQCETVGIPGISDETSGSMLLIFRLKPESGAKWSDSADSLRIWIQPPKNVKVTRHLLKSAASKMPDSTADRSLAFDFKSSGKTLKEEVVFKCRAVYELVDKSGGKPKRWWRDFEFKYAIAP